MDENNNKPLEGEILELPKFGRPPKFNKDMCAELIYAAQEGKTVPHFCVRVGISQHTYYDWKKKHPEFAHAAGVAEAALSAFYHDLAVHGVTSKFSNTALIVKLFDHHVNGGSSGGAKGGTHINVNIDNTPKKDIDDMSPEERQIKLEQLRKKIAEEEKQKLLEEQKE